MLNRLIDALFWMGRYLERAENTARIVDVNYYASIHERNADNLADPDPEAGPFSLNPWSPTEPESMVQWLILDKNNPSSVASCLAKGHENGQIARNKMDGETWESLNRAYINYGSPAPEILEDERLHEYTTNVKRVLHEFKGTIQSTMFRGEAWYYLTIGQYLERADNCLRQLQVLVEETNNEKTDTSTRAKYRLFLESIGATILLQKTDDDLSSNPDSIVRFLIQSDDSPRCLLFLLRSIQESLQELSLRHFSDQKVYVEQLDVLIQEIKTNNASEVSRENFTDWIATVREISNVISEEFQRHALVQPDQAGRSFQSQQ